MTGIVYHKLPDKSPYLYFRMPTGQRLLFPRAEVHTVDQVGARIFVTTIFGKKFQVTSKHPEIVSGTYAEQAFYKSA